MPGGVEFTGMQPADRRISWMRHAVGDGGHGRDGADAKRQRQHGDDRKAGCRRIWRMAYWHPAASVPFAGRPTSRVVSCTAAGCRARVGLAPASRILTRDTRSATDMRRCAWLWVISRAATRGISPAILRVHQPGNRRVHAPIAPCSAARCCPQQSASDLGAGVLGLLPLGTQPPFAAEPMQLG